MSNFGDEEGGRDSGFSDSECGGGGGSLSLPDNPSPVSAVTLPDTPSPFSALTLPDLPSPISANSLRLHFTLDFISRYSPIETSYSFFDATLMNSSRKTPPRYFSTPKARPQTTTRKLKTEKWSPVKTWLSEVRERCEPEAGAVLQNKPLWTGTQPQSLPKPVRAESNVGPRHWQLRVFSEKLALLHRY